MDDICSPEIKQKQIHIWKTSHSEGSSDSGKSPTKIVLDQ